MYNPVKVCNILYRWNHGILPWSIYPYELQPVPAPLKIPRNNVCGGWGGGGEGMAVTKIIFLAFSSLLLYQLKGIKQIISVKNSCTKLI